MPISVLIGLAAGLVSAVVFVSATTGPPLAQVALFVLTPLPLYLAGLGLGWQAAAAGAASGFLALGLAATPIASLVFAASVGLPAAVLSYLALLSRGLGAPATGPGPSYGPPQATALQREWYPIGRLVVAAALIAGGLILVALLALGHDVATMTESLAPMVRTFALEQLPQLSGAPPLDEEQIAQLTEAAVHAMPAVGSVTLMSVMLLNLYLAGRITLASGRLPRPWPDLATTSFPSRTPLLLAVAMIATFVTGMPSLIGAGFAGGLYLAYVLMGLAVVHFLTRGQTWRPLALWMLYIALFVMNTGLSLLLAILGLADSFAPLRRNRSQPGSRGGPPSTD